MSIKKIAIILILTAGVILPARELFSCKGWLAGASTKAPKGWFFCDYNGKGKSVIEIISGKICRISSSDIGMGYLGKRAACQLNAGMMVRISGRYRTGQIQFAQNGFARVNVKLNAKSKDKKKKYYIGFNLKPSKEWQSFKSEYILPGPVKDYFALFQFYRATGWIEFADLKLEIPENPSGIIKKDAIVVWKEAEDSLTGAGFSAYGNSIKDFFSGRGGYYSNAGHMQYRFKIKNEVDAKSLLDVERDYSIWGRIYGYIDQPAVTVRLDKKKIFYFTTKPNEVNFKGTYYWQRLGSFRSKGGVHELSIESTGRMLIDAFLFTDDKDYVPKRYEGKAVNRKNFIKDIKLPIMIQPAYRHNSVSPDVVSPIRFDFILGKGATKAQTGKVLLRIPDGIRLCGASSLWSGTDWKATPKAKFLSWREIKHQNKIRFYEIDISFLANEFSVYIRAEAGTTGPQTMFYSFKCNGKLQEWTSLPLSVVKIPATTAFKTIRMGPCSRRFRYFYADFPDFFATCKQAGVNLINPWTLYPARYPKVWQHFKASAKKYNILIAGEISPLHHRTPPHDLRAVGLDGKQLYSLTLSATANHPWVKIGLNKIAELAKYVDYIVLDDEHTNYFGDRMDYHPKVLAEFAERCSISPKKIVKNKKKYQREYQQWIDFKCELNQRRIRLFAEAAAKVNPKVKILPQIVPAPTLKNAKEASFWDYTKMGAAYHLCPMIYTYSGIKQSAQVGDWSKIYNQAAGRVAIWPTLLCEHSGFGNINPPEKPFIKYGIWEALMERARMIFFWEATGFFQPINLQYFSEAVRVAVPYENFFLDGEPIKLKTTPRRLRAKGLRLGNKYLLYAADYTNPKPLGGIVQLPDGNTIRIKFKADRAIFIKGTLK
jgi:hypothetical protein